ncbi:hypothetical protein [Rhizobium phage RHEph12]|nr:hypothetical protein [Rhizobium phage RHEph12]
MPTAVVGRKFECVKGKNPDYWVHITAPGRGFEIVAEMPEETTTAVGSEWEARLPSSIGDLPAVGGFLAAGGKLIGTNAVLQGLTKQVWVNSSPVEIPISLQFDMYKDALEDVYRPMRSLELLVMPNMGPGGLLYAPGPTGFASEFFGGSLSCNLTIGKLMTIPNVIAVNVSSTFASRLDARGYPTSGRSDITFRTDRTYTADEWAQVTGIDLPPI